MADPAHALDGFLAAFGANSTHFALATPDGRIKTYDTVSGRLRSTLSTGLGAAKPGAADGHLVEGQQCLTWVDSQELSAEAAGDGSGAGPAHSWVAIGTSAGTVKLYDSSTGELQWAVDRTNEGGVACLAHSTQSGGLLYASGPDGVAVSLDPATGSTRSKFKGSKHGASAAALSADGSQLLLGGSTLTVWELSDQQRVARLAGHPLPVRAVAFSPDKRCVLSAAEGERLVAVWVLGGGKRSAAVAAASLAVSQPVVQLATTAASAEQPAGSFYAAGTTQGGEAYVWLMRPLPGAALEVQQVARLAVDPRHAAREVVFGVALEPAPGGATVVAAVGTAAKPRFERVQVGTTPLTSSSSSNGSHLTFLQPPPAGESLIQPGGAAAAAGGSGRAAAPEVLGPDNAGQLVQQRVGSRHGRKRSEPEPAGGVGAGGSGSSDEEGEDDGMEGVDEEEAQQAGGEATLGQRVQQLERQQAQAQDDEQQQQQQGQQPAAAAAAAAARGDGGAAAELPAGPLKADSLAVLLSQALRSSDKALLERCLAVGRERVVVNTVKRLVPMDAALLLRAAVERLQSKPKRGAQLAAWIQAVLLHHTAYLMAAPAAAPLMSSLYQIIEARLSTQRQLLSLTGRLDLLLAQRGPDGAAGGGSAAATVAQVSYQESDSEAEVEIVDAAGGDASDDYYTDDDEDGDEDGDELGSGSSDDDVGGSDSDGDDDDEAGDMDEDDE